MKKNNVNKLIIISALLLIFAFFAINDTSIFNKIKTQIYTKDLSTVEYNWYFNPREDGKQPLPIQEANFFKDYDSYYVGNPNEKIIYLTFDSGYENGFTNHILDVLKKHNVPGNFFVVESYIKNNPDIIKRMEKEGHLVCNHSVSHTSMASIHDKDKFNKEILDVANTYKEITGKDMPKFFRPPMGKYSINSLKKTKDLGYKTIFWSFAYKDWIIDNQPSEEEAIKKITNGVHPGCIMLIHAVSKTNTAVLKTVIEQIRADGYEFKPLTELPEYQAQ